MIGICPQCGQLETLAGPDNLCSWCEDTNDGETPSAEDMADADLFYGDDSDCWGYPDAYTRETL